MSVSRFCHYSLIAALLLVLGLSPFAFGAVHPLFYTAFQLAILVILAGACLWYSLSAQRRKRPMFRNSILVGAAFAVIPAIQLIPVPEFFGGLLGPGNRALYDEAITWTQQPGWLPLSVYPLGTALSSIQLLACLGIFLLVVFLFHSRRRRLVLTWSLIGTGVLLSAMGLYQNWHSPGEIYGFWESVHGGLHFGPFVNRNHFAGYLEMIIPLAAALVACRRLPGDSRRADIPAGGEFLRPANLIALGSFLIMSIALVSTLSRGGMVAVGAAACTMSAVAWWRSRRRWAGVAFAGLFAGGFLVGTWYASPDLVKRLVELYEAATDPWQNTRTIATARTLQLFSESPLTGVGLGGFQAVFTRVQTPELGRGLFRYAHNDWAQLIAETGLAGLALGLTLAVLLARSAWSRISAKRRGSSWWLTLGATGSLVALGVHSLFDFNLHIPSNAFLASAVAGLLLISSQSAYRRTRRQSLWRRRPKMTFLALGCLGMGLLTMAVFITQNYRSNALLRDLDIESASARDHLLQAHRHSPQDSRPVFLLSRLHASSATETDRSETHYRLAIRYARLAVRKNPAHSRYHHHLALLHENPPRRITDADLQLADKHYRLAVRMDPAYPEWTHDLARFYLKRGRFAEADTFYARLLRIAPQQTSEVARELVRAGTSLEHIRRLLPDMPEAHLALARELLRADRTTAAAQLARSASDLAKTPDLRSRAVIQLAHAGQSTEAMRRLRSWMVETPPRPIYLETLARLHRANGEEGERIEVLKTLAGRFPKSAQRQIALADAYRQAENLEAALDHYRRAWDLEPRSPRICDRIVELLLHLDRADQALEVARRQMQHRPGSAEARYRVGKLLLKDGRVVEAAELFREARRMDPTQERYRAATRRALKELKKLQRIRESGP